MKSLFLTAALLGLAAMAGAKAPNILFILADDQSWNGTSVRMMNQQVIRWSASMCELRE